MARIFVSYSRKNKGFCKRLTDEFTGNDLDFWVDWEDIHPTVDWMSNIQSGIEEADTFLAIVTPEWITSKVCIDELELAVKNGKRLIPVVPLDINWDDVPPALAQLNFIFFTSDLNFDTQFELLHEALNTDYDWLKTQSRLQVKALEWKRSGKENGYLLRGQDLEEAEREISINANKDPNPTDLQREYILLSRQGSTRQRRITTSILIGLIAGMLGVIGLLVRPYVEDAIAKAQARELSRMVPVPAGSISFQLGDTFVIYDLPEFNIEMQPVTNQVYDLCVKVDKCTPPIGSTDFNDDAKQNDPVIFVTIVQAATYCEWIGRRQPSAPEWELANHQYAKSGINEERLILSNHYEWTSSYEQENSQGISGEWDGQIGNLNIIDWAFLQEQVNLESTESLEIYTNTAGAFDANTNLSFRCANK